jgi:hypothetical protein
MSLLVVRTRYAREADELAARLKDRGVILTPNSQKLLYVGVQGWYEEPPEFVGDEQLDKEKLKSLLWQVVDHAVEEDHVALKKAKGEPVAFTDLFAGLFESGRDVAGNIFKKGF